jgi:hypothetical protein
MLAYGPDRVRRAGERVILHSTVPKGWTPRVPKTLTSPEHPGTAVLWEDEYFEVIEANALPNGGVRYVLGAWPENHTIRQFEHYNAETEALHRVDHERAKRQRRYHFGATVAGIFLGHLPARVQNDLENELGVRASRLTLVSCIPPLVILGLCLVVHVGAMTRQELSPVPFLLWPVVGLMTFESFIRFFVAMSQGRPMGSSIGVLGHAIFGKRTPVARGESVAYTAPTEDVALRGSFEVKEPLLTLLSPEEQKTLAQRFGFDYRRTASRVAWVILVCALVGAITSKSPLAMIIAAAVVIEQATRLVALRKGPASSIFAPLVRPFARNLFR